MQHFLCNVAHQPVLQMLVCILRWYAPFWHKTLSVGIPISVCFRSREFKRRSWSFFLSRITPRYFIKLESSTMLPLKDNGLDWWAFVFMTKRPTCLDYSRLTENASSVVLSLKPIFCDFKYFARTSPPIRGVRLDVSPTNVWIFSLY